uniref:Knottin scorpion toxin-like domain-containing protein n=1 Tax=Oryza glaberrima TaxID=4538 RepID=I1NXQ0_ORYGL
MVCKVTSIFSSILIYPLLTVSCATFPAPDTTCESPQACANQCVANGYLIGFCEIFTLGLRDCVCVKCPNAQMMHADHLPLQSRFQ